MNTAHENRIDQDHPQTPNHKLCVVTETLLSREWYKALRTPVSPSSQTTKIFRIQSSNCQSPFKDQSAHEKKARR